MMSEMLRLPLLYMAKMLDIQSHILESYVNHYEKTTSITLPVVTDYLTASFSLSFSGFKSINSSVTKIPFF